MAQAPLKLAFLRSTWPRGSTQPIGATSEMAVAAAATLTDPPSPDMAVADINSATGDVVTEGSEASTMGAATAPPPGEPIAPVSDGHQARLLSVPITSVSDAPPPLPRSAHPIRE